MIMIIIIIILLLVLGKYIKQGTEKLPRIVQKYDAGKPKYPLKKETNCSTAKIFDKLLPNIYIYIYINIYIYIKHFNMYDLFYSQYKSVV